MCGYRKQSEAGIASPSLSATHWKIMLNLSGMIIGNLRKAQMLDFYKQNPSTSSEGKYKFRGKYSFYLDIEIFG